MIIRDVSQAPSSSINISIIIIISANIHVTY